MDSKIEQKDGKTLNIGKYLSKKSNKIIVIARTRERFKDEPFRKKKYSNVF